MLRRILVTLWVDLKKVKFEGECCCLLVGGLDGKSRCMVGKEELVC